MGEFKWVEKCRKQFFDHIETPVDIPLQDQESYPLYPQFNWVYNKLELYKVQGIEAFPHGVIPKKFPIFSKPITNLYGMSIGAGKFDSWDESNYKAGYLWMPYFEGQHFSVDVAITNGEPRWFCPIEGVKGDNDVFLYWKINHDISTTSMSTIYNFIFDYFTHYTGFLNFEIIDDKIIECHLRCNSQITDLVGGDDWVRALISLYLVGKWKYEHIPKEGYAVVLRIPKEHKIYTINEEYIEAAKNIKLVSSIQITTGELIDWNDDYTTRLAVVNGYGRYACQDAINILKEGFGVK